MHFCTRKCGNTTVASNYHHQRHRSMNTFLLIVLLFLGSNRALSQSRNVDKIIGVWWSTKTYKQIPIRVLTFGKDNSYTETVNGSIGSITVISKYYFVDNTLVIGTPNGEMSDLLFYGKNKFKFIHFSDTLTDYKYKLIFKRRK
jgi:hypothetical protein